jgi:ABC-type multidrug transport system fused ATPase/permease subunit
MIAAELFLFALIGITLLVYDPILTLSVGALFTLIVLFLHRTLGRITQRNAEIVRGTSIDTLTAVSEALATYRETTVLNRRDLYVTRYEGIVGRYATASASNAFVMEIPKYVLEVALYAGILVIGVVQFLTKDWGAAAATVALFLAAGTRLTPALLRLQGAGITIKNASVAAQPTFFLAETLQESNAESGVKTREERITSSQIHNHIVSGYPDFEGGIFVEDVWLTYPDATDPALADVTFTVQPGASVALVGSTGAGKSSLADVLLGVHAPQQGRALIGGITPREAIDRWPGAIAYVPQAVALIEGTVRENVALGLPSHEIDDELVWEALQRAHLADFLVANREGLDTAIGERGFRLSGGQRQRLGIARALYTRPRLLVLDEATSSLDAETEQAISQTLSELEGEVTTVTVAHRLATVRFVDQLLYLKHGRVIARGSFDSIRNEVPDFDRQASLLGL